MGNNKNMKKIKRQAVRLICEKDGKQFEVMCSSRSVAKHRTVYGVGKSTIVNVEMVDRNKVNNS